MNPLKVNLLGVTFDNPLTPAAGPIVGTLDNLEFFNNSLIGAIVTKTISVEGAKVAKPCIVASKHTVYNTELWSEKHHDEWVEHILPELKKIQKKPVIVSIGYTSKDAQILVPKLDPFADFFEVSTHYGKDELKPLVTTICKLTDKPVFIKLSPHVEDYIGFVAEAVKYGAAGVVAINSVGPGLVIDLKKRAVTLGLDGGKSWISGPAIKPIALNRVMNIRNAFPDLPIIAAGGVESAEDVLEFVLAGADLVQMLSTALIKGRKTYDEVVKALPKAMKENNIESIESLRADHLDLKPQGLGGHPEVDHDICTKCQLCVKICPEMALSFTDKITLDSHKCMQCGLCESRCPVNAIKWGVIEMKLRCITCQKEFEPQRGLYTCEYCGDLLGTLEVIYDYKNLNIKKDFSKSGSIFQYASLLPVKSHTPIDDSIGGTPLYRFKNLLGLDEVMIKYDGISFSSSYKDRASIIAVNKAIEEGYDTIYCASTGNAASSLALTSAHTDLKTVIFVPAAIPKGKLSQLLVAGAEVIPIKATYDEVFDISPEIGREKGWYCRNSAINPYLLEGKKTGAFEILVQNDYQAPDYCIVSVGDGTVVSSLCKGFTEFFELGLTDSIPKVIGVQAQNASTIKHVFDKGEPFIPITENVETIADSIAVGNPRDVIKACTYVKKTDGYFISVTDHEILSAIKMLAQTTGIFAEPAGAAAYAGLKKMVNEEIIKKNESVCIVVTGNGLKDIDAVKSIAKAQIYTPDEVYRKMKGE